MWSDCFKSSAKSFLSQKANNEWARNANDSRGFRRASREVPLIGDHTMGTTSTPDALNAFVRVLLAKTATKPAPARYQLQNASAAVIYFGGLCAYCAERPPREFDHATPINRHHLGENVIGKPDP
jgi:hypothetical protein